MRKCFDTHYGTLGYISQTGNDESRKLKTTDESNKFLVRLHGEYNILVKPCGNTT